MVDENLKRVYEIIENSRRKYGYLRKCEFHLHTPASYDYKLTGDKLYSELTISEILEFAEKTGYLKDETKKIILDKIDEYTSDDYVNKLKEEGKPYGSFKEYISFMIIAHKLYSEGIEVAIISDHNTISGYEKLKYALNEYYIERIKGQESNKDAVYLLLGVEISCSDKNHVIVIYDDSKIEELQDYLDDILLSEKDGTYYDSRVIIDKVSIKNGIGYIAHLNSWDWLGSNAYKKKLLSTKNLKIIGLTNIECKDTIIEKLSTYCDEPEKKFGFIYEGDSHSIESIGVKNTWIKFNHVNYQSLKKAIDNKGICIYDQNPSKSDRFIKGIVIYPGQEGFLGGKKRSNQQDDDIEAFNVCFSRDLNCIIGGRGTGKSTLLNIIETMFSLECDDKRMLEFISKNRVIYSVFYLDGYDYILRLIPQTKDRTKYYYLDSIFMDNSVFEGKDGGLHLSLKWVELFRIEDKKFIKIEGDEINSILSKIFRRGYNINKLVNKINCGQIGDFIRNTVTYGINYDSVDKYIYEIKNTNNKSFPKYLRLNLNKFIIFLANRKHKIHEQINQFNIDNQNLIEVIYSPKEKIVDYYLNDMLDKIKGRNFILNTYLTWDNVQSFIYNAAKKMGYLNFLNCLFNKQYEKIEDSVKLSSFIDKSDLTYSNVELELKDITSDNINEIYRAIYGRILNYRKDLQDSIIKCFKVMDDFTIHFNINSRESIRNEPCIMKDIEELSLGQKVIAILTFVFNFGVSVNDNTPLLIDQPEDNLDNQYIYKNLVKSLRGIKNCRQVVVVTHNSTIVTNADAEEVIVMDSDNSNGWVEKAGYPSDKVIIEHIINYMEGGKTSFKHKINTYSLFIPELCE